MSNIDVSLDVRNFPSNGTDGYTNTTASNGAVYSYQYGGGSDGHGGVDETVGSGSGTITVSLHSDARYRISDVHFSGDVENQLSWQPGNAPTVAIITDSDTATGSGYYSVTVTDTTASCTLLCDPEIQNRPKPPQSRTSLSDSDARAGRSS